MKYKRGVFRSILGSLLLYLYSVTTVSALGPIDGEVILSLWNNQFESDVLNGEVDVGSLTASGEIWIGDNWGIRAARYENDLEESAISDQNRTQLEIRKRFISLSDNNFFALGLGLEDIDLINGESSKGPRVSAEARLGLTPLIYIYGRGALMPEMEDAGNFRNLSGSEVEFGVSFTPLPFVSIKAGFLKLDLEYDNVTTGSGGETRSDGLLIGAGIHW